ncbi:AraC family transcriptional regulator [Pseudomonas chlororaphis]|uniref:AraC family transcriptional regulator n=1 Tax=Pseudomonas chlororaphis TaxID=587753 RepID=UPI0034634957
MDPLSEVLSLLSNEKSFFGGLKAGGDWAIRFPAYKAVRFTAVVHGVCWVTIEGTEQPIKLEAGDCFMLTRRQSIVIGSDLSLPAISAGSVYSDAVNGIAQHGDSEDCFLISGRFSFDDQTDLLMNNLPPIAVIKGTLDQAAILRWALQQLTDELSKPSLGSTLVAQHLGHIMLVQVLRIYLAQEGSGTANWLSALAEPRIAATIRAIHSDPVKRWTVESLAEVAGVSRSTLASRFKQLTGMTPLEYVSRWRMQLAIRSLRNTHVTISSIAETLGYESDSAFSSAFKRIMKCSPSDYRHKQKH